MAVEYCGARTLIFLLSLVPYKQTSKLGYALGSTLRFFSHKRFKRSVRDLRKAFPDMTQEQAFNTAKDSWANIGRIAAEFSCAFHMTKADAKDLVKFVNAEDFIAQNEAGKGCLVHIGHFANWELFGLAAPGYIKKMAAVARPMSNGTVDKVVTAMRSSKGTKILSAYNPLFGCLKALKQGYAIAVLSDQSVPSSKIYMDFLGRPAEVGPMTALLSLKTGLPVFPVDLYRENGRLIAKFLPAVYPKQEYSHKAMVEFTKELNGYYEDWIRKHPQDWLWGHNRWKREEDSRLGMIQQEKELKEQELKQQGANNGD